MFRFQHETTMIKNTDVLEISYHENVNLDTLNNNFCSMIKGGAIAYGSIPKIMKNLLGIFSQEAK